ncbi:MAG: hypothetical protein GEU79_00555 [Acidimicrobiia bacterium]|nr:hypothetical protein [Acidimicrobiia bacterium]
MFVKAPVGGGIPAALLIVGLVGVSCATRPEVEATTAPTSTLTVTSTTGAAPTTQSEPVDPPGAGDPLAPSAGNPGYDVSRYDWRLSVNESTGALSGIATLNATAVEPASSVWLDYTGPAPERIQVDGRDARFSYTGPKIEIETDVDAGDKFTIEAILDGTPEALPTGDGWVHDEGLVYAMAVLPGDTASWIPLNDTPTDPAVFSVTVGTAPGVVALASGTPTVSDGVWTWETPVAVSEIGLAVGRFESRVVPSVSEPRITLSTPEGQIPPSEAAIDNVVGEMLTHLESYLGPFPFPTVGLTMIPGFPGANSTPGQIFLGVVDRHTIYHELSHQWIAGSVGTASSTDVWLREGITEYLAFLWISTQDGELPLESEMRSMYDLMAPSTRAPRDMQTRADRSDWAVYMRGPLTIHALRQAMGDDSFPGRTDRLDCGVRGSLLDDRGLHCRDAVSHRHRRRGPSHPVDRRGDAPPVPRNVNHPHQQDVASEQRAATHFEKED